MKEINLLSASMRRNHLKLLYSSLLLSLTALAQYSSAAVEYHSINSFLAYFTLFHTEIFVSSLKPASKNFAVHCAKCKSISLQRYALKRMIFSQDSSSISSIEDWALLNRVSFDKVEIRDTENSGRGLFAKETIFPNEVFLEVPLSLCFIGSFQDIEDTEWPAKLALDLIIEYKKADKSSFYPYLSTLPGFISTPLHWDYEDFQAVSTADMEENLDRLISKREYYWSSVKQFSERFNITKDEFYWALDCVQTRNCKVELPRDVAIKGYEEGCKSHLNMVIPIFDMMNHCGAVTSSYTIRKRVLLNSMNDNDLANYVVEVKHADKPILKNCQICLNYGEKSVDEYLLNYGFVPSPTPSDVITIQLPRNVAKKLMLESVSIPSDDSVGVVLQTSGKVAILQFLGISLSSSFDIYRNGISSDLLIALKIINSASDELKEISDSIRESKESKNIHDFKEQLYERLSVWGNPHSALELLRLYLKDELCLCSNALTDLKEKQSEYIPTIISLIQYRRDFYADNIKWIESIISS
jgi:hypothetical protein